ncbi:CBM96 family carbohydrate-binding protein [Dyadobacter bucti]|uniref:CBM96 family carbohydrate-binding protein n=1 Tax=Dyadobacter bucti TaxID=2572203 RepID=UPI001109BDB8|nr:DNRLRE domain-containing protein [Dyadobacter bucti]
MFRIVLHHMNKKIISPYLAALLFLSLAAQAQPATVWEKVLPYGTPTAIVQTTDGGFAVLVASRLIKLSAAGATQWERPFTTTGLRSLEQTADGGYILGGSSSAPAGGDKSENPKGTNSTGSYIPSDYWVIKLSATGSRQWDRTLGGNLDDVFASVHQTKDGGYLVAGYSSSSAGGDKTEGPKGANLSQSEDYWLVKLNATGTKLWDKSIGGGKADILTSMELTADGGFILGGLSSSNAGFDKSESGNTYGDFWIVKVSANGTNEWDNTLTGGTELRMVKQASDLGYLVGGWSDAPIGGDKTEASKGRSDFWLIKLATNGTKIWDKVIGGNRDDKLKSLELTADGGYILGGTSSSDASGDKSEGTNQEIAFWSVKVAGAGSVEWEKTIPGSQLDGYAETGIKQTTDAGFIFAGGTYEATQVIRLTPYQQSPQPQIMYLRPVADSYVRDGSFAPINFGGNVALEVKNSTTSGVNRASYLKFALNAVNQIGTAKLRVFGRNVEAGNSINLSAYSVSNDSWTETGINWLNAPASGNTLLASTAVSSLQYYELDVTNYVKAQLAGDKTASFVLRNATGKNTKLAFNSKESATNPPQLVITTAASASARTAEEKGSTADEMEINDSRIFPNPVRKQFTLETGNKHKSDITLDIVSASGIVYKLNPSEKPVGNTSTEVDLSGLSLQPGMHLLVIRSEASTEVIKVMVVR